jgi:hypothetical protein
MVDCYPAAQNLYTGATAWLAGRTRAGQQGFAKCRHQLRHGHAQPVVAAWAALVETEPFPEAARETLTNVYHYLQTHAEHSQYAQFKTAGWPIGSGRVESACQWLIQHRFTGGGRRWSEPGFDHLLQLRWAWVNRVVN